jgi:dUTP pyrophosphatase
MKIKKLRGELTKLPVRMSEGASCMDAYAHTGKLLRVGEIAVIPLGFGVELSKGFELQVRPRSGLFAKHGITCHLGTIDSDYRGEVGAIIKNDGSHPFAIEYGDRIAQVALCRVEIEELEVIEELSETERGAGGFGHTGKK